MTRGGRGFTTSMVVVTIIGSLIIVDEQNVVGTCGGGTCFLAFNFALLVLLVFIINERRRRHAFERNASVMILSQYGVRCSVFSSKSIDEMVASLQSKNFLRRAYDSSFSIEVTHLAPNAETISSSEQPICSITVITVISLPLNGTRKVLILVDFADGILH